MSEFLRKHLLKLTAVLDSLCNNTDSTALVYEKQHLSWLIRDVEAHQKVITLKKPAPIDYQQVRMVAEQNQIPLHIKSDALDWNLILDAFRKRNIKIPTIPTIYEQQRIDNEFEKKMQQFYEEEADDK